jgi:hypothetical protein
MRRVLLFAFVSVLLLGLGGCWPDLGGSDTPVAPSPTVQVLITMPDVTGQNAAVAVDKLEKLGFTDIDLGTVDGRPMVVLPQNWTVKTQSAKPGEQLPAEGKIVLGCVRNG